MNLVINGTGHLKVDLKTDIGGGVPNLSGELWDFALHLPYPTISHTEKITVSKKTCSLI
jgi:hypothetical protein